MNAFFRSAKLTRGHLIVLVAATAACGDIVDSASRLDGGPTPSSNSGDAGVGRVNDGSPAVAEVGPNTDAGARDAGARISVDGGSDSPGNTIASCVSSGSTLGSSDGGCAATSAFAVCNGDILQVDCNCPVCNCRTNDKDVVIVSDSCGICPTVADSWNACGFPAMP